MERKICTRCIIEKIIEGFYSKYTVCKVCNSIRSLKRCYENKEKLSNQRKLCYEKNRDVLLAKSKLNQQNKNYERKIFKQQVEEINRKLEDLTQAFEMVITPNSINDSEINQNFFKGNFFKTTKKELEH